MEAMRQILVTIAVVLLAEANPDVSSEDFFEAKEQCSQRFKNNPLLNYPQDYNALIVHNDELCWIYRYIGKCVIEKMNLKSAEFETPEDVVNAGFLCSETGRKLAEEARESECIKFMSGFIELAKEHCIVVDFENNASDQQDCEREKAMVKCIFDLTTIKCGKAYAKIYAGILGVDKEPPSCRHDTQ